jgi:signal transduction histidine kinase
VEGIELLKLHQPDLVITDIRMPGKDGIHFLSDLKLFCPPERMPVIFCVSGYSDLSLDKSYQLWVNRIFQKPVDPEDLLSASANDLERHLARGEIGRSYLEFMRSIDASAFLNSAIVHEITNSVSTLSYVLELLHMRNENETLTTYFNSAVNQTQRLRQVIELIRSAFGGMPVRPVPHKIEHLLQRMRVELEKHYAGRIYNFAASTTGEFVAKPMAAEIILYNLVKNAWEASPEGSQIDIEISESEGYVNFTVSNDGAPIQPALVEQIFSARLSTKPLTYTSGMGIGLYLSNFLAQESGGTLAVNKESTRPSFLLRFRKA